MLLCFTNLQTTIFNWLCCLDVRMVTDHWSDTLSYILNASFSSSLNVSSSSSIRNLKGKRKDVLNEGSKTAVSVDILTGDAQLNVRKGRLDLALRVIWPLGTWHLGWQTRQTQADPTCWKVKFLQNLLLQNILRIACPRRGPSQPRPAPLCPWRSPSCSGLCLNCEKKLIEIEKVKCKVKCSCRSLKHKLK